MTDDAELQRAAESAEAEVAALEGEFAALTARRARLSADQLEALAARNEELRRALGALTDQEVALHGELATLKARLAQPGFRLSPRVATPLTWYLRAAAFLVYAGGLVASYRSLQGPGMFLMLLIMLPVAFVAVMMAGSLRESGAAGTTGVSAGPGEEPARVPGVELEGRVVAAPGGPVDDRAAERGAARPPAGDREGL